MALKIGTCGWGVKGGRASYFSEFNVVELQSTFYNVPRKRTLEAYKKDAPVGFEFVVKAWQAITHPLSSPTWRKAGRAPEWGDPRGFGHLKPTPENFRAWEIILEACATLGSRFVVVQTPPSFRYSEESRSNAVAFFSQIDRGGLAIGWEPRGEWNLHPEEIRKICEALSLVHIVDPFRRLPACDSEEVYFRLHGIGSGETNYGYTYSDADLAKLLSIVSALACKREVYVMFNNKSMGADALRFKKLAGSLL